MADADTHFSVLWEGYQRNICKGLSSLQQKGEFVDMTLAADGHFVKVHQIVMALASPYIRDLISSAPCSHPVIFLNQVSYQTLQSILEYAYTGEVLVTRDRMNEFLVASKALQIRGLEHNIKSDDIDQVPDGVNYQESNNTELKPRTNQTYNNPINNESFEYNTAAEYLMDEDRLDDEFALHDKTDELNAQSSLIPAENRLNSTSMATQNTSTQDQTVVQFSLSQMGKPQIILNRFIYLSRYVRKNKERLWRCVNYLTGSCPAFVLTRGERIVKRACAHNHPYHDKKILKKVSRGLVFTALHEAEEDLIKRKTQNSSINT